MARDVARERDKKPVSCFMAFDVEVIAVRTGPQYNLQFPLDILWNCRRFPARGCCPSRSPPWTVGCRYIHTRSLIRIGTSDSKEN